MNFATKLFISFFIIILLFISAFIYSDSTFRNINELYLYRIEYQAARHRELVERKMELFHDVITPDLEYYIQDLLHEAEMLTDEIILLVEGYIAGSRFRVILLIILAVFCAAGFMVFTLRSFRTSLNNIEQNVKHVESGNFAAVKNSKNPDEMSKLIQGLVDTVTNLANEINTVIKETDGGSTDALISESKFSGGFKETAIAINNMINSLRESIIRSTQAEENSLAKSHFLARMSHEIRTPISSVLGISELQLRNAAHDLYVQEAFAKIYNSSQVLLGIVNDILDLSKIESGKMSIIEDIYDVTSLIVDIAQMHIVYLGSKTKKLNFYVEADENLPIALKGDQLRIKQVINNILTNAFKFTEEGMVELKFRRRPSPRLGFIVLEVIVRDTGVGIPADILQKIVSNNYIKQENHYRYTGGTGLGMPIVHNLIQLMDAEMDIQSQVGVGTNITIRIPQATAGSYVIGLETAENIARLDMLASKAVKKADFEPEILPHGKVLVVDDVDTNLYVAKGFLNMYKLQIDTCTSGHEAIEKIKNGQTYDIIFMDQMMPELDGVETTKILRDMGYSESIIALTANALIGHADILIKNGFDGFISKPINSTILDTIVRKHVKSDKAPYCDVESLVNDPELVMLFLKDMNERVTALEQVDIDNLTDNSFEIIKTSTHAAAGILSCVDQPELMASAKTLEHAAIEKDKEAINGLSDFIKLSRDLMKTYESGGVDFKKIAEKLKAALENEDINEIDNIFDEFHSKEWLVDITKTMLEIKIFTMKGDFSAGLDVLQGFLDK